MANTDRIQNPFIPSGNPDTMAVAIATLDGSPAYAAGQVGGSFELGNKTYTLVTLDSGATSATPTGAVAANQLLFWKDKVNNIVTNDRRFAAGSVPRTQVAGVARVAVPTPGKYGTGIAMLVRGNGIPVNTSGTPAIGDFAVADAVATTGAVTNVASGTAPGYPVVGIFRSTISSGNANVDVDIPLLP
jgi:hypothetical protein